METAPSSFSYVFTPISLVTALTIIASALLISPFLSAKYLPFYQSFSRDKQVYWNTLPGAIMHAILLCSTILLAVVSGSMKIWSEDIVVSKSEIGFVALQMAFGYFVGDFIVCVSLEPLRRDFSMMLHHAVSMSLVFIGLYYEGWWMSISFFRLFTELSSPFVHLRWILSEVKVPKTSLLAVFTAIGMTSTFLLTRIVAMPLIWYAMYVISSLEASVYRMSFPIPVRTAAIILMVFLDVLNVYWSSKVARGFFKWLSSAKKGIKNH